MDSETRFPLPNSLVPEIVLIPAGRFLMGSDPERDRNARDNEQPQHTLYLPDYYMARTPVTSAQYLAFVQGTDQAQPDYWKAGGSHEGRAKYPVIHVSWYDAVDYCH
jgi:formylglycine-generating enzyme required for sulfatase activity